MIGSAAFARKEGMHAVPETAHDPASECPSANAADKCQSVHLLPEASVSPGQWDVGFHNATGTPPSGAMSQVPRFVSGIRYPETQRRCPPSYT